MTIDSLSNVPKSPGVYIWKNKYGDILYIGKAKNLNNRMKQYFKGMLNSYKTAKLVEQITSFDYIITNTEKDALILERNLIAKHIPEFNIKLTDNKRYPYIYISLLDKGLKIGLAYRVIQKRKNTIFYGPFPSGYGAKKMSNLINRMTTYKDGLPYASNDSSYWRQKFFEAKKMLSPSSSLIKELEQDMLTASDNMQYEIAADIKEVISALSMLNEKQTVEFIDNRNIDVIGFVEKDGYLSIAMMFYRQGLLLSKSEHIVEITSSKEESVRQFINQYYANNLLPDIIISNEGAESELEITIPLKGSNKKLLANAIANAEDNIQSKLRSFVRKEELTLGATRELEKLIGIDRISTILMIDNSNTNNTNPVSTIVAYKNGIKQHANYRKYKVEVMERKADVDYMKQGVTKYFSNEKNIIPDLFIVDGGIAQVNEVKKILPKDIPLIGLVKNDKHVTEALITCEGKRVEIESSNLLNFLKGIQIEVDRYAKSVHSAGRVTQTLEGILRTIPGIGPAKEKQLLTEFKDYASIYNASVEDLEKFVSPSIAKLIKEKMVL